MGPFPYLAINLEDSVFVIAGGALVLAQLIVCIFGKKRWVRWLPLEASALLMALCFLFYGLGGWTNWGFLILIALLFGIVFVQGLVLFIIWVLRKILKK